MSSSLFSRVTWLTLVPLLVVFGIMAQAERSYACSCGILSPSGELAASYAVFVGKVISKRYHERDTNPRPTGETAKFQVETVWKGPVYEIIHINASHSSCGFRFAQDTRYLVYASEGLGVGMCSRTTTVANATEEIATLGKGQIPEPGTIYPDPYDPKQQVATKSWSEPEPDVWNSGSGGGCGQSRHSSDVSIMGLMIGIAGLYLRTRRSGTR